MREIKFRYWNKTEQRMYYTPSTGCWMDFPHKTNDGDEWLQYTGLKDKNGKEIYEGDIIKVLFPKDEYQDETEWITEVIFDEGNFIQKSDGVYLNVATDFEGKNFCEVLGNIYENPELLK